MICVFDQFDKISEETYTKLFSLLPHSRKKIAAKRKDTLKKIAIVEYFLLKSVLKFDGFPDFSYSKNGKPYLEGYNFSIAHTSNVFVVATGKNNLGVDIEQISPSKLDILSYFSKPELKQLSKAKDKALFATKIFTKKEALIKLLGGSLSSINDLNYKIANFHFWQHKNNIICLATAKK